MGPSHGRGLVPWRCLWWNGSVSRLRRQRRRITLRRQCLLDSGRYLYLNWTAHRGPRHCLHARHACGRHGEQGRVMQSPGTAAHYGAAHRRHLCLALPLQPLVDHRLEPQSIFAVAQRGRESATAHEALQGSFAAMQQLGDGRFGQERVGVRHGSIHGELLTNRVGRLMFKV